MIRGTAAWSDIYLIIMYEVPRILLTLASIAVALLAFSWKLSLGFVVLFAAMMLVAFTLIKWSRVPRSARV